MYQPWASTMSLYLLSKWTWVKIKHWGRQLSHGSPVTRNNSRHRMLPTGRTHIEYHVFNIQGSSKRNSQKRNGQGISQWCVENKHIEHTADRGQSQAHHSYGDCILRRQLERMAVCSRRLLVNFPATQTRNNHTEAINYNTAWPVGVGIVLDNSFILN